MESKRRKAVFRSAQLGPDRGPALTDTLRWRGRRPATFPASVLLLVPALIGEARAADAPRPGPTSARHIVASPSRDVVPPVIVEVSPLPGKELMEATAVLTITARIGVSKPRLEVRTTEAVRADPARLELKLDRGSSVEVQVSLQAREAGEHRMVFAVEAEAAGYEAAGTTERRYLLADGKSPARILGAHELGREKRAQALERIKVERARSPDRSVTLDTFLAGGLKPIATPLPPGSPKQALVPPSSGIEPYDRVVDKTSEARDLDPITITGRFFYLDRTGGLRPLVNASVDVRDAEPGSPDEHLVTTITDWDGAFMVTVNNHDGTWQDGRDIYLRVKAGNNRFRVRDCAGDDWTYAWKTDTRRDVAEGSVVDFGALQVVGYEEAAIVFQDLNQGWNHLTTAGAQDPGGVTLCFPEDSSYYSTGPNKIYIEACDETAASPWVPTDVVLHEYGHATMHNAYDGYWPPDTGGPHGFEDILHPNFAFTEGWATFVALSINDDGSWNSCGWIQPIESYQHVLNHTGQDGNQNEGHIAAGMGDVRDRNSDGGCGDGDCDPSGPDNAPLLVIWRDAFWGSEADNIYQYLSRLCTDLEPQARREAAAQALLFNHLSPLQCACAAETAVAGSPDAQTVLHDLRQLRNRALRGTRFGRWMANLYYRHTDEVSRLMSKDGELRRMGSTLFQRSAESYGILERGEVEPILLDARTAEVARRFIARVQASGSERLRQDFQELKPLVETFEGLRAAEVRSKLETPDLKR